jgi:hypothetical protein
VSRRKLLAAVWFALASMPATAETPKSYFCEIKNEYRLSDAGTLQPVASVVGARAGDRFQINIKTGEMNGPASFSSASWARISVIDSGTSPSGSFLKVMYSSPPGGDFVNVAYLQIQGTIELPNRSFLYSYSGSLYSGVCSGAF